MIAVDTNVLLRRLLDDDPAQAAKARRLFESHESILVTDVVLVEAVWTLTGKRYRAGPADIDSVVMGLLEEESVVFESRQAVWSALNDYRDGSLVDARQREGLVGFSDALIVNKARIIAQARSEPYEGMYTCDQAALGLPGTKGL